MQASSTLAAMQAAEALRAEGANVVDFGAGEPDFDTPDNIKRAAEEAMRAGKTKYTSTGGTRELQQSIIDFYADTFGASYERNEVMATFRWQAGDLQCRRQFDQSRRRSADGEALLGHVSRGCRFSQAECRSLSRLRRPVLC